MQSMAANTMNEPLTAAQMRAIEAAAIAAGGVSGLALMERAGRGVVAAIFEEWPDYAPASDGSANDRAAGHRALVLCGPGNNGGDGFVVARLLQEAGWVVTVILYGDPDALPPDAKTNHDRWRALGDVTAFPTSSQPVLDDPALVAAPSDLIVDALFGTGLRRPFTAFAQAQKQLLTTGARRVAIDVPSGLCADSGRVLGSVIPADLTVSFHRPKLGHYLADGPEMSGRLRIVDIGLAELDDTAETTAAVRQVSCPAGLGKPQGHKYDHGHALILAGGVGRGGAARLAARAALRIGAGAVTLGCPPAALIENAAQLNAVMLRRIADGDGLVEALADHRINALCLGPGFGLDTVQNALIGQALQSGRSVVLDADALTLVARDAALFDTLHESCVLTPHAGEFARLFPDLAEKLDAPAMQGPAYSKLDATRDAAVRAGCVVLFKGADTVIAAPSGECRLCSAVYDRAVPWLATAGSGDVLAGLVTGLLARGFAPLQAAGTGAWLHQECARAFGPGLIAEDLPEQLPGVLRNAC